MAKAKSKKATKKPLGRKAMKKTRGGKVQMQDFHFKTMASDDWTQQGG